MPSLPLDEEFELRQYSGSACSQAIRGKKKDTCIQHYVSFQTYSKVKRTLNNIWVAQLLGYTTPISLSNAQAYKLHSNYQRYRLANNANSILVTKSVHSVDVM